MMMQNFVTRKHLTNLVISALSSVGILLTLASCYINPVDVSAPDPCQNVNTIEAVASWQPPILPLKLSISSTGKISVSLIAQWVTFLGKFSVSTTGNHYFPQETQSHLLVIRTVEDGEFTEAGYEINCDREYRVFLNGEFQATVDAARTTITAEPGTNSTIAVVDAQSGLDPDMRPLPEYKQLWSNKTFDFPDPISEYGLGVDLDANRLVGHFVIGSELDSDDADVWYHYIDGISAGYNGYMGKVESASLTPEQCREQAKSNAVGDVDPDTFRIGQKFCVITSKNNVAFMELIQAKGPEPERYALTFNATFWLNLN